MTELVWVAIISAAAAILGDYVGGWREARNQDKAWHRDQRKAAYADCYLALIDSMRRPTSFIFRTSGGSRRPVRIPFHVERRQCQPGIGIAITLLIITSHAITGEG